MTTITKLGMTMLAAAGVAGCGGKTYENQRPPVDQLDARDRGLQSKDVVDASERMAMSLLSLPQLTSSNHRWTVVFTGVRNQTTTAARQNLDIFIARLKGRVGELGRDKMQIIANRDAFNEMQGREREMPNERDDFQQGSGRATARPAPGRIDPDFYLEAVAMDLGNRGTNYYNFEFRLIDFKTREQVWTSMYEVRVAN